MMNVPCNKVSLILILCKLCAVLSSTTPIRFERSVLPLSISGIQITMLKPTLTTRNLLSDQLVIGAEKNCPNSHELVF